MPEKKPKVKLGLKNLAMFPIYFGYIFVHLRQKARLGPELSSNFLSPLDPNPTRKARPDLQLWRGKSPYFLPIQPRQKTAIRLFFPWLICLP